MELGGRVLTTTVGVLAGAAVLTILYQNRKPIVQAWLRVWDGPTDEELQREGHLQELAKVQGDMTHCSTQLDKTESKLTAAEARLNDPKSTPRTDKSEIERLLSSVLLTIRKTEKRIDRIETADEEVKQARKKATGTNGSLDDRWEKINGRFQAFAKRVEEKAPADASMRGYKITSDGKKTSYFHNELDEKTKNLIGDTTPKRIQSPQTETKGKAEGASAWNAAGTWESKDRSQWARDQLLERVKKCRLSFSSGAGADCPQSATVCAVRDMEGDASITTSKGKRRHAFDLRFKVTVRLDWPGRSTTGTLLFEDVSSECAGEYDTSLSFESSVSPADRNAFDKWVGSSTDQSFKQVLVKSIGEFVDEFKEQ